MKQVFYYIDQEIIWVLIASIVLWFGGWRTSGLPPAALAFLAGGFYFLIVSDFRKRIILRTKLTEFVHKHKPLNYILVLFLFLVLGGIAKEVTLLSLWTFIWLTRGVDIADKLIRDNPTIHGLTDIFVVLPVTIALVVLYLRYLRQAKIQA